MLAGDVREPPPFTSDSGHTSQTEPRGDRAVEPPRLRVFDNWGFFLVLVILEKQTGAQEEWSHSQAYGSRLSATMENDKIA